jgi:hypothetical protein
VSIKNKPKETYRKMTTPITNPLVPEEAKNSSPTALLDIICDRLDIRTSVGRKAVLVALENCRLLDKKHQDYGPLNITAHGELGILVRMTDKVMRLNNLFQQKRRRPRNEAVIDSYADIANYAVIAVLLRTGQWS